MKRLITWSWYFAEAGRRWFEELMFPTAPVDSRCPKCNSVRRGKGWPFRDFENRLWQLIECGCGLAFRRQGKK